jgi:hypothetical protein
VMKVIGPEKVSKSRQTRKLMKRLDLLIREDIPQLRRSVADYHKNLQKRDQDPGNAESNG